MTNLEFLILLLALMSAFIGGYWMKIFKDLKDENGKWYSYVLFSLMLIACYGMLIFSGMLAIDADMNNTFRNAQIDALTGKAKYHKEVKINPADTIVNWIENK